MTSPVFSHTGDVNSPPPVVMVTDEAWPLFRAAEEAPERDPEHDAAVPSVVDPLVSPVPERPEPIVQGTFVVYDDGNGGVVLVIDQPHVQPRVEPVVKHIPAGLIKLAGRVGGGGLGGLFGAFGGR